MNQYFIEAESFKNLGGWAIDQQSMDQMGSPYIMAHGLGVPVADAETEIDVSAGRYAVWARTRDWTAVWGKGTPAGRFDVRVDGEPLPTVLGTNGAAWAWQKAGEIDLGAGRHTLALHDLTGFNGRCDAIYMTDDLGFTPPDDTVAIEEMRRTLNWHEIAECEEDYDLIVAGGGVAGVCMALAARRTGTKTLLVNDRGVLGGCNSSDIRVCMGGQIHLPPYPRLGDVVREIAPVMGRPTIYPAEYFEDARKKFAFEPLEYQETKCDIALWEHITALEKDGDVITAVVTTNVRTGRKTRYHARLFADCTGDATLARMAGCAVMYGREAADTFGESLGAPDYQRLVMGHSLRWYSQPRDEETPFPAIDWGFDFDEDTCYFVRSGDWEQEAGFRRDMVEDIEYIRDYGLRAIFSNWNFQKNLSKRRGEYARDALEWISPIGGKRESYRVVGDHILTQADLETPNVYDDATACITWSIDIHFPEPDNEARFGEAFRSFAYHRGIVKPYPVPYRCLYARDVRNLFLGGRDVSASHVAFSAIRVMRTLGTLGEAAGLAASVCTKHGAWPRDVYTDYLDEFKAAMTAGVPIPDSFNCGIGDEEAYHFKDLGWIHFHPYRCESENEREKIRRNVRALGMKHKYEEPDWLK